ncbi:hypothetical protein DMENIID0001_098310 [Sergentomyia squamirostris]
MVKLWWNLFFCIAAVKASPTSNRVVGGVEAIPHSAPYVVSLQWNYWNNDEASRHFCGGVILSEEWILTAAHCMNGVPEDGYMLVVAGKHDLKVRESGEQSSHVDRKVTHHLFTGGIAPYDLTMLHLVTPLQFSETVRSVSLPSSGTVFSGNLEIFGWGSISADLSPKFPNKLQRTTLPILNWEDCEAIMGGPGVTPLHQTNICTGPLTGGQGACHGDSGSALVHFDHMTGEHVIVGIVSWGFFPCGAINSPSIYTDVAQFLDWIHRVEQIQ